MYSLSVVNRILYLLDQNCEDVIIFGARINSR